MTGHSRDIPARAEHLPHADARADDRVERQPAVRAALSTPGVPLAEVAAGVVVPHDLGQVRVHADTTAARAADAVGAAAFTRDDHVFFGKGEFRPGDPGGRALLNHELAHVVEQRAGSAPRTALLRQPSQLRVRAREVAKRLRALIKGAVWKEIRKRVYPAESAAGIARAKERKAGTRPDLTGLGSVTSLERMAGRVRDLKRDWATKTPKQRVQAIGAAANAELAAAGVPGFITVTAEPMVGKGAFQFGSWTFLISDTAAKAPQLTDEVAAEIANTTMHESRHAEQRFLAARYLARRRLWPTSEVTDPDVIASTLSMPVTIAKEAVKARFRLGAAGAEVRLGKQQLAARTTGQAANDVETGASDIARDAMDVARDTAMTALQKLREDITPATVDAAEKAETALAATIGDVEGAYKRYRAVVYEADAHEVGDAAEQAFRGWK